MTEIAIRWISDEHQCDNCGSSYADGAVVSVGGVEVIDMTPAAYCFDGTSYSREDVLRAVIAHLGHTLVEDDESTGDDGCSGLSNED